MVETLRGVRRNSAKTMLLLIASQTAMGNVSTAKLLKTVNWRIIDRSPQGHYPLVLTHCIVYLGTTHHDDRPSVTGNVSDCTD